MSDQSAPSPVAFTNVHNWGGGCYELAIELGGTSDERLGRALEALWPAAGVRGCYGSREREPSEQETVPCTFASLTRFTFLRGLVELPRGGSVVCYAVAVREDRGPDWLCFSLPMGTLAHADPRVGGYPAGEAGGPASMAWRLPIDNWLAGVGAQVYSAVDFRLGIIGFQVSGQVYAKDAEAGRPLPPGFGYLRPADGALRYEPTSH